MSKFEMLVEELKSLPPAKLDEAAGYIHQLKVASAAERQRALDQSFGCLSADEADQLSRAISANCEKVDASQW
jgi:hypothetical protein